MRCISNIFFSSSYHGFEFNDLSKVIKTVVVLLIGLLIGLKTTAQIKVGDQPTSIQKSVALDVQGAHNKQGLWLPRVSDTSITGIRAYNPPDGLILYHSPSGKVLLRSGNAWEVFITDEGIKKLTVGSTSLTNSEIFLNVGTSTGTSNDINIAANTGTNTLTFNIPDASTSARGAVTTGAQTFGGIKTFNNNLIANSGATINNGATVNGGLTTNNGFTSNNGATIYNGANIYGPSAFYNGATVQNGLTVSGGTAPATNLTLGVTSASTPSAKVDNYLSVNNSGIVTLNVAPVTTNIGMKMKSYQAQMNDLPLTVTSLGTSVVTFTISGANLSTQSSVVVSPNKSLQSTTKINWARVVDATTIEMSVTAGISGQNFTPGNGGTGMFNITVIEF